MFIITQSKVESLRCSRQDNRHFAVVLAGRLDGDFNVLAKGRKEIQEALDRKAARTVAHESGNVRLFDAEDVPGPGLCKAALLYEAVDLQREMRAELLTIRIGKAKVGKDVAAAVLDLGSLSFSS